MTGIADLIKDDSQPVSFYQAAKERHPGMLLLFRVGESYECLHEDATDASKLLGLVLTNDGSAPMARFPSHHLEAYLQKLLRSGKRVAVCEAPPVYDVKCDDCKATIRTTSDVRESYAGGRCAKCAHDHDLPWLIDLLRSRLDDMKPREKTLTIKLCKAGAKKLLGELEAGSGAEPAAMANCCQEFRENVAAVAKVNGKTVGRVWLLWKEYASACDSGDQSAIWSEFLKWYAKDLPNLPDGMERLG